MLHHDMMGQSSFVVGLNQGQLQLDACVAYKSICKHIHMLFLHLCFHKGLDLGLDGC